jgi:uncharacterized protein (TIGR02147 family)
MQLTQYRDYRSYLRDELEHRLAANPRYSMRAFARDLKMSPQMLSFVLNRKKSVSPETAAKLADRLNLSPEDASHFVDLVMLVHSRQAPMKKLIEFRIEARAKTQDFQYRSIEVEAFKAIADWQHYALLELPQTKGFKSDIPWIARRLGMTGFEVKQAVERLKRLELLEEDERGRLRRTELNLTATYGAPNAALRKLAKQFLEKAAESLESQSLEERDITNITMAIDPKLLPEAKTMITEFRRKLCAFLEQGEQSEVYTFAPALFRLTKTSKGTRK